MSLLKKILPILFLLPSFCNSQQISFAKSYHLGQDSYAYGFCELPDSGFILVGYTKATSASSSKYSFAMRMDKYGDTLWTRKYLQNAGEINEIVKIDDSTYIVSGGFGLTGGLAITLAKMNLNGDTLWSGDYGYSTSGWAGRIYHALDNGYIINNGNSFDYGLLKLDSSANVEWHTWQTMYYGCTRIKPDFTNGYVAVGGGNSPFQRYEVARLDSSGTTLWQYHYGNQPAWDMTLERFATDVVVMPDSNYLVGSDGHDWQLMKIDHNTGDTIWTKSFCDTVGCSDYYTVGSMDYAGNNHYILAMGYFMLVDANGDSIWKKQKPFRLSSADVHKTSDGGYAFCGQIVDPELNYLPVGFVKLDSLGNTIFTSVFNPENNLQPLSFYPNPASNEIYLSPGSMANEKDVQFALYDLQGRSVLQQQYTSKPVDASAVPEGLYIAVLKGKEKEVRGKVVVSR
jgi:hypothetical protein